MVSDCSTQDDIDDNKKDSCADSNEREYCGNSNERECANNKDNVSLGKNEQEKVLHTPNNDNCDHLNDISSSCSDSSIDDVSVEIPLKGKDRKYAAWCKERIEMKRNEIIKVKKKSELKQCEALKEGSDVSLNQIFHLF